MVTFKLKHRLATDKVMLWSVCILAALTAVPLVAILGEVLFRGYDQLSWSFFTEPTPPTNGVIIPHSREDHLKPY